MSTKKHLTTILLFLVFLSLLHLNIENARAFEIDEPTNVIYDKETNTVQLNSLTIKQKIAQMTIAWCDEDNKEDLQKMLIGGIYINARESKEVFINTINNFQDGSIIPLFTATDAEGGCSNPFSKFQNFKDLVDIKTEEESYQTGYEEGQLLKELGFNLNFAPVAELDDNIWHCRNFRGSPEEISDKAKAYIKGLQEHQILATVKHYPGKTLIQADLHQETSQVHISSDDLLPFEESIKNNVSAIMISHVVAKGKVTSIDKPSTTSRNLVGGLRNQFTGLIITDDTRMLGLRNHYSDYNKMYAALFHAGNDIILFFDSDMKKLNHMIYMIDISVNAGEISEEQIDASVTRILQAKGINVE